MYTLQHSSNRIHHVRARGVSSLGCGELLLSEPVICHPTIPHISVLLPLRERADWSRNFGRMSYRDLWNSNLDANQSFHFSPQRQFIYVHQLLRRVFANVIDDNTKQNAGRTTVRVRPRRPAAAAVAVGSTMRACILCIMRRVAFVIACHVLSSCSLILDTCSLHYILQ